MVATVTSFGFGRFISGQLDTFWVPRRITRKRVIYYSPPGGDISTAGQDNNIEPGLNKLLRTLQHAGFLVIVGDNDGHAFGHDGLLTEWETFRSGGALAALVASLPGGSNVDTSKIIVGGHSQGATDACRYAQQYPTHCAANFGIAGLYDLQGAYTGVTRWGGDGGTLNQASIGTAWGIAYPTPLPSQADPYNNAGLQKDVPTWVGYSDGDTSITSLQCKAYAAAVGPMASPVRISTTQPHNDAEASDAISAGLVSWLCNQAA